MPNIKNKKSAHVMYRFSEAVVILALFVARIFRMEQMGLFDYDSVRNYLTVQEICQGDFSHLFHHASPSLYVFYSPFYLLTSSYLALEYINAAVGVLAVIILCQFFKKCWQLNPWHYLMLLLGVGSCTLLVLVSRYFSMENTGLLCFAVIIVLYHKHLQSKTWRNWVLLWCVVAIAFTFNYKTLLLIPVLLLAEFIQANRKIQWKALLFIPIPFGIVTLAYSVFAWVVNIGFLNYAKYLYVVAFIRDTNPQVTKSKFDLELSYYFNYLYDFENSLLGLGILLLLYIERKAIFKTVHAFIRQRRIQFSGNLLMVYMAIAFFGGLSIIEKAPRVLLVVYPFIYAFSLHGFLKTTKKIYFFIPLALAFFLLNLVNLERYIYRYSASNYDKLAQYIAQEQLEKVYLTVGLGLVPFLNPETTSWQVIFSMDEIPQEGQTHYVVVDDYYQVADLGDFEQLEDKSTIISFTEPSLCSPLLYLEHCEYTDKSYDEALATWKKVQADSVQIRLGIVRK